MTLTDKNKEILNFLLADNDYICSSMFVSLYANEEDKTKALHTFKENNEKIKEILGVQIDYRKKEAQRLAQYIKDAEENKEHIEAFAGVIKDVFEDIRNPSTSRVYKINPEAEGGFEISVEEQTCTDILGVQDPFEHLKQEPNATREQWDAAMKSQEEYFEQDYANRKEWYAEAIKEPSKFDWAPIDWQSKPTKTEIIYDEEIISMAKGFMVGPVGLYNGRAVAAAVQKFDSLAEMQIFLKVQAKTQDMVMYMAFKQQGKYLWRGAFVERDEKKINQTELLAQDISSVLGSAALKELTCWADKEDEFVEGLERYPLDDTEEMKFVTISKILVPTERDKEQLLKAFKYLHNHYAIDPEYYAVNTIIHTYSNPDLIEVENE